MVLPSTEISIAYSGRVRICGRLTLLLLLSRRAFCLVRRGVVFGQAVPVLKEKQHPPRPSDDLEIDVDLERVRLETDRCFFNHVLLSRPQPTIAAATKLSSKSIPSARQPAVHLGTSSRRELIFAEKLRKFLLSRKRKICVSCFLRQLMRVEQMERWLGFGRRCRL